MNDAQIILNEHLAALQVVTPAHAGRRPRITVRRPRPQGPWLVTIPDPIRPRVVPFGTWEQAFDYAWHGAWLRGMRIEHRPLTFRRPRPDVTTWRATS